MGNRYSFKPTKRTKPTHKYMGELFLMCNSRIWIWSCELCKWMTMWKSFDHDELTLLFEYSNEFRINA